jgi:Flp pilus assembly protein TadG
MVEMALVSVLLALLLAGAVDFGRAYYTDVLITNMAAEGAAYASLNPDFDKDYPTAGSCSEYPVLTRDPTGNRNIQARVKLVATEHGLIVKAQDLNVISTTISVINTPPFPNPNACTNRCMSRSIQVQVR